MKKTLRKLLIKVLSNDTIGRWAYKFSSFAWQIKFQRELIERSRVEDEIEKTAKELFKDMTVLNGTFKGMKYPSMRSRNSSLYPKLLGSYELELQPAFEEIISKQYDQILDVGCAEGYYAVGLAMRIPKATVYAYDIEAEARDLTGKMAKLNGVADRVKIESSCTTQTLASFPFKGRSIIISDCEGYEKNLFTKDCLANLKNTDLLIETHDFMDVTISTYLEELFSKTHDLEIIRSLGDVIKAKTYKYRELEGLDVKARYRLLEEGRRFTDEWLYLKAK
ncbi:MAG: methyltransferase [Bacteroidia bacterium]|nr:methyltransferase [Bacteroidia bacterium]